MKTSRVNVRTFFTLLCVGYASITAYADMTLDQLVRSKKYSDAIAYADAKLPSTVRTADVWVKVGIANEELGTTEKALACFLVASRMDVKSYDAQIGIARVYNKLNQPDNALTFAKKAMDMQSTGEASWEYAKACMALKRPGDAQDALEKVIQSDPTNAAASRGLAEIYWQQKEYKKAIPLLKVAYASNPNADDAYKIGRSLLEANRVDSAMYYLKEAITRNPGLYAANLDLARAYFLKDKFLAAANEYEKVADKVRMSAMDQYNRAICQEKTGSMEMAMKAYRAAADAFGPDKSPEATTSHLKAGNADLEKKNYESALVHYRYIAAADSEGTRVPDIQFLLADAYSGSGNLPRAIACLEKALAADNKNVEAYARLADLYQKSGAPDKARQVYEKITTLNPNDPKIFLTLGDYSLKAKKYTDALRYYEKSYLIDRNVKAAAGMASAAAALEQWEEADITKLKPYERARRGIAYVPQGREIFPLLTVEENLKTGFAPLKRAEREIPDDVFNLFPVLKDMLHRRGGDLSGGQQQQLAIGRALVMRPRLLLLDEQSCKFSVSRFSKKPRFHWRFLTTTTEFQNQILISNWICSTYDGTVLNSEQESVSRSTRTIRS